MKKNNIFLSLIILAYISSECSLWAIGQGSKAEKESKGSVLQSFMSVNFRSSFPDGALQIEPLEVRFYDASQITKHNKKLINNFFKDPDFQFWLGRIANRDKKGADFYLFLGVDFFGRVDIGIKGLDIKQSLNDQDPTHLYFDKKTSSDLKRLLIKHFSNFDNNFKFEESDFDSEEESECENCSSDHSCQVILVSTFDLLLRGIPSSKIFACIKRYEDEAYTIKNKFLEGEMSLLKEIVFKAQLRKLRLVLKHEIDFTTKEEVVKS